MVSKDDVYYIGQAIIEIDVIIEYAKKSFF